MNFKTGQGIIFIVAPLMGVKGVIMERTWRLRKGVCCYALQWNDSAWRLS